MKLLFRVEVCVALTAFGLASFTTRGKARLSTTSANGGQGSSFRERINLDQSCRNLHILQEV